MGIPSFIVYVYLESFSRLTGLENFICHFLGEVCHLS